MKKYFSYLLLLSASQMGWAQHQGKSSVYLRFNFNDYRNDTLTLQIYPQKLGSTSIGAVSYRIPLTNGMGKIKLPVANKLCYFHLESAKWPRLYMDNYLAESGDQVLVSVDASRKKAKDNIGGIGINAEGQGANKYQAKIQIDSLREILTHKAIAAGPPQFLEQLDLDGRWTYYDTSFIAYKNNLLSILNPFENKMSSHAFATMRADIIYQSLQNLNAYWRNEWSKASISSDSLSLIKKLRSIYDERFVNEKEKLLTSNEGLSQSWAYLEYLISNTFAKARLTNTFRFKNRLSAIDYIPVIQQVGQVQFDRLSIGFLATLLSYNYPIDYPEGLVKQLMHKNLKAPFKLLLDKIVKRFFAEKMLYPFTLSSINGKNVSAKDLIGKKLLIDFWSTGCLPCIKVAENLNILYDKMKNNDSFMIISICLDERKQLWRESVISGKYTSKHHLNLYTNGLGWQHPFVQHYGISSIPRLLLVDSKGKLQNPKVLLPQTTNDIIHLVNRIQSTP